MKILSPTLAYLLLLAAQCLAETSEYVFITTTAGCSGASVQPR